MNRPQLSVEEEVARAALDLIMSIERVTDGELAELLGNMSTQQIQQRRTGYTRMRLPDIERCADALDVPIDLFRKDLPAVASWFGGEGADVLTLRRTRKWVAGESNPEPADIGVAESDTKAATKVSPVRSTQKPSRSTAAA